mmetsp:Transcript_113777/g.326944  ORF Transcript_113777/g.326944 Transcript_113777/m.326944 type:complete len:647 (+) Transcript_113777:4106-6046(+)
MNGETIREQVLQLLRFDTVDLGLQDLARGRISMQELREGVVLHRKVPERCGGLGGFLPRVHEDQDLILAGVLHELLVADLVHCVEALDRLLVRDADVCLLQGAWAVLVAEVEQALLRVHAEENGDILVVRQGGGQPNQSNVLLRRLDLSDRTGDDGLQHGAAGVVEQMDLVDDDEPDQLRISALVARLARNDVPLLRRRHDDLGLVNLRLGKVYIAAQLADHDAVALQALLEALDDLLHKRLHRGHVDDLEARQVERTVLQAELRHHVEDREHRAIRLARACRRADEHVLAVLAESHRIDLALHVIELLRAGEALVAPRGELRHGDEVVAPDVRLLEGLDVHLLVTLLLHPERACGQLALLVRHVMAATGEGQGLQVEHVRGLLLLLFGDFGAALAELRVPLVVERGGVALSRAPQLQLLHLLPEVPSHVLFAVALLRGTVELLKHGLRFRRLAHVLEHGVFVVLRLGLTEPCAVQDFQPVLQEQLRELEVLVLQHLHQLVLALLQVLDGEDRQDLLLSGDALVRVRKNLAELALQPVGVDLLDVDHVLALLLLLLLLLVLLDGRHVNAPVVAVVVELAAFVVVVIVVVVADLADPVPLLVVLVVLVENDGDAGGVVEALLRTHGVVLLLILDVGPEVRDLLGKAE